MKNGLFRGQTPQKAKARLFIVLALLGAALILLICVVAVMLNTKPGGGDTPSGSPGSSVPSISAGEYSAADGCVSVADFGAVPSDGKDDTEAFRRAAASGLGIYIPAGEYRLSGTVELNGQDVVGEGMAVTSIRATAGEALFRLSGNCRLTECRLSYEAGGAAGRGEKTAVRLAAGEGGGLSPSIKNVRFEGVGTAVFVESGVTNGVRLEDLIVESFGYAGVVFDGAGHRGAILRGIALGPSLDGAVCGVELQGDEGTLLEQVTLAGSRVEQGVRFDGSLGFSVKTVQFLEVRAQTLLGGDKAAGRIGSVFLRDTEGELLGFTNPRGGAIQPEYTAVR